jgi:hypothetical protein
MDSSWFLPAYNFLTDSHHYNVLYLLQVHLSTNIKRERIREQRR